MGLSELVLLWDLWLSHSAQQINVLFCFVFRLLVITSKFLLPPAIELR